MAEQVQRLLNIPAVVNQHLDGQLEPRETVIDLLTEVAHFAHAHNVEFMPAVEMALENELAER